MASIISPQTNRDVLMLRVGTCLGDERYDAASRALEEFLRTDPRDRECWLLWLLCNIKIHGLQPYEHEIEKLKRLSNLDCREKAIIKRILIHAIQQATLERRADRALAYRRLVRSLVRGSSPDSFSMTEKIMEIRDLACGGALRVFKSQESLPAFGWRSATLSGLLCASIALIQMRAESGTMALPTTMRPIPSAAFESRSSGANNSGPQVHADGQRALHSGASAPTNEPTRSKDAAISRASFNRESYEAAFKQAQKESVPEATKTRRAAKTKKTRAKRPPKNTGQALVKPVPNSATDLDHLKTYRTRIPVNVRREVGFAAPTLETIGASADVTVLESKGTWFKVRTHGGGNVGYVPREAVVPADDLQ
jgi:hypothetical protein